MALKVGEQQRDREAEVNGVWFEFDEDTRFLVARANNPGYKAFVQREYSTNERAIERKNEHADKLAEKISLEAICRYILLGWEGVVDQDNRPIPFSPAKAMEILEEYDDVRVDIYAFATDRANFLKRQEDEAVESLGE